jgi:DNA-binding MarR family transcriptional regulator
MATPRFLMIDLLRAVYWFDEALQAALAARGWNSVTRSQSLVLCNIAAGIDRASQLARNLGVSRQAMSQMLSEMRAQGLVVMKPDRTDRRAQVVGFSEDSAPIRDDAMRILRLIEDELATHLGSRRFEALVNAVRVDWGPPPMPHDPRAPPPSAVVKKVRGSTADR